MNSHLLAFDVRVIHGIRLVGRKEVGRQPPLNPIKVPLALLNGAPAAKASTNEVFASQGTERDGGLDVVGSAVELGTHNKDLFNQRRRRRRRRRWSHT